MVELEAVVGRETAKSEGADATSQVTGATTIAVSVFRPSTVKGVLPGWVVLHGLARPGRRHPRLVRFARALAASRAVVAVPEVPQWRALRLAPEATVPSILAGLEALERERRERATRDGLWTGAADDVAPVTVGVAGFSFGGPHAIAAAADDRLRGALAAAVSFGGYGELLGTVRYLFTGEHERDGRRERSSPDPYGRWIIAGNYLTLVPGCEDASDVARALLGLARRSGDVGAPSSSPAYEPDRVRLRRSVAKGRRQLFDLLAPPFADDPDPMAGGELADRLVEAALAAQPQLEPLEALAEVRLPVHIVHGRSDRLIPYSQAYRLVEAVGSEAARLTVTRLFTHSDQDRLRLSPGTVREVLVFARALSGVLGGV